MAHGSIARSWHASFGIDSSNFVAIDNVGYLSNQMEGRKEIFPAQRAWPPAIDDWNGVSNETTEVRLVSGAKNLQTLNMFPRLKALWCFDIDDEGLEIICNCPELESLFIENLKTGDLGALKRLPKLSTLGLESCSKISSLECLQGLVTLGGLAITNFKNVHDLTPLGAMTSLRFLALAGSMWTRMKVETFAPLGHLQNLEFLRLTNIKADDESLKPLAKLHKLKLLDIANFYPMNEFAELVTTLRATECAWLHPFLAMQKSMMCKKCKKHTMVMLTGKRKPILCTVCDSAALERHVKVWDRAVGQRA